MHAKVLNLPFRSESLGFDDAPLAQFLEGKELVQVRDYFFTHDGRPYLSCFIQWNGGAAPAESAPRERRPARDRPRPQPGAPGELDALGQRVRDALRAWRAERSRELRIPAYRILTNRQLDALARERPADLDALEGIAGIGPATVRSHGADLLTRIRAPAATS